MPTAEMARPYESPSADVATMATAAKSVIASAVEPAKPQ